MKRVYLTTALTCMVILGILMGWLRYLNLTNIRDNLKVGFICDGDESTSYTYNFSLAKDALERIYGDRVQIAMRSNVLDDLVEGPLRDLAENGYDIIFFSGYSASVMALAPEYPDVQFCQASWMDMSGVAAPPNYHTFKGEAFQARYVSGIAAGMKIREMIANGIIPEDGAIVGFVAAFPTSEIISGYTAFLLGVRSIVPQAVMRVRYTENWCSYPLEKNAAQALIDEGCVVITQHTDTIGPAVACEEAYPERPVVYVGYGQSMSGIAPGTSLVTARICWEPYVLSAVEAVMTYKTIEKTVPGNIHGTDISAGFDRGWLEILDLNQQLAAPGTQEAMDDAIEQFRHGKTDHVFRGNYTGVDPSNPADTYDLRKGYAENENTSYPTFHYLLTDVITVE